MSVFPNQKLLRFFKYYFSLRIFSVSCILMSLFFFLFASDTLPTLITTTCIINICLIQLTKHFHIFPQVIHVLVLLETSIWILWLYIFTWQYWYGYLYCTWNKKKNSIFTLPSLSLVNSGTKCLTLSLHLSAFLFSIHVTDARVDDSLVHSFHWITGNLSLILCFHLYKLNFSKRRLTLYLLN